jgi:cell division protein ZapA
MSTGRPQGKGAPKQSVEVQILGQRMVLKAEEDARRVERLASYVQRKVDELSTHGPVSSAKLAVLAALNIADDYFRALDDAREFKRQVAHKSRALLSELDK